jgi:mono/diheme cytochrome c family protein
VAQEHDPNSGSSEGDPQYGPTYYAPVEMPLPRLPRPPFWMIAIALIGIVATWLPLAIIARARESTMAEPRIQILQDMAIQPKFKEQAINELFADDRSMRPRIPGTVAYGSLENDDSYYHGFVRNYDQSGKWTVVFAADFPPRLSDTPEKMRALLMRGQQRFNIYCYVCHGYDGSGHGPVNERAVALKMNDPDNVLGITWSAAAQLTSDTVRAEPVGNIFNKITNGYRTMPSYSAQIPVDDRWAIVAYVRALQMSQGGAPPSLLTQQQRGALQGQ